MKKIIWILMLVIIGFIGGIATGGVSGSVGGGLVGMCLYNAVALKTKVVSRQESRQIAQELVQRLLKQKNNKLNWLMDHASFKTSEGNCKEFLSEIQKEFKKHTAHSQQ